jgi:type IV secretion system protein TrbL
LRVILYLVGVSVLIAQPAFAQEGSVLTSLQSQITTAAKGWETTVMDAAKSLFWILATIEIGIAAVWLATAGGLA